ncbi:hypothetical protein VARIO8X_60347 [Burkholderiales bacterium 8X]|nr:hypothetical protein VARIO8X_60347 [Burkholderiales bacterium 8X]
MRVEPRIVPANQILSNLSPNHYNAPQMFFDKTTQRRALLLTPLSHDLYAQPLKNLEPESPSRALITTRTIMRSKFRFAWLPLLTIAYRYHSTSARSGISHSRLDDQQIAKGILNVVRIHQNIGEPSLMKSKSYIGAELFSICYEARCQGYISPLVLALPCAQKRVNKRKPDRNDISAFITVVCQVQSIDRCFASNLIAVEPNI